MRRRKLVIKLLSRTGKRKGIAGLIFSRTGIVLGLLFLAVVCASMLLILFGDYVDEVLGGTLVFNIIVIMMIANSDMDSSAKLTWALVIGVSSIFGTLFYLYTKFDIGNRTVKAEYARLIREHRHELPQDERALEQLREASPETAHLAEYLFSNDAFPVSTGNEVTYYPLGEYKWADMLTELQKAEKFIFMEYFIIEEGEMWGSILNILCEKAAQGVDVRVMYDGTCALGKLPYNYPELVEKEGIKCKMFSPIRPLVSTHYNYRDHRKILVIDGKVGFCGGVNLADEYINKVRVFGHWKDTALRIKGAAVRNLTHMFLNMWCYGEENVNYAPYLAGTAAGDPNSKGYVIPYGFNPFDKERVGEQVYIDMLYNAKSYVHITTPYLILDDELLQALKYAGHRGIDVRIILPGIPDKKAVYALAKTFLPGLIASGVKVYFYTPGFVHAKVFVSDDIKAIVGTINMDYRSLYHHFECGTFMYDVDQIADIEEDYQKTLEKCEQVTIESIENEKLLTLLTGKALKLIAPLL